MHTLVKNITGRKESRRKYGMERTWIAHISSLKNEE